MREYVRRNFVGSTARCVPPIIRINFVAYGDVSHCLRKFQRTNLVFRIWFCIDGIGRTEEYGSYAQATGEESLREIDLQLHISTREVADIGMGERMVSDAVTFAVDTLG